MATQRTATILVSDDFKLKVVDQDFKQLVAVRLTRLNAQYLADALLEFARGWGTKGGRKAVDVEEIMSR